MLTDTTTLLAGRPLLESNRDAMTTYMVTQFGADPREAELAIEQLWTRWVLRCATDTGRTPASAGDAVTAALAFLTDPAVHSPGALADDGWHTMLGYTREYAALCHALTGHFIHHCPNDVAGLGRSPGSCHPDGHCDKTVSDFPVMGGGCTSGPKCGGNPPCPKCTD